MLPDPDSLSPDEFDAALSQAMHQTGRDRESLAQGVDSSARHTVHNRSARVLLMGNGMAKMKEFLEIDAGSSLTIQIAPRGTIAWQKYFNNPPHIIIYNPTEGNWLEQAAIDCIDPMVSIRKQLKKYTDPDFKEPRAESVPTTTTIASQDIEFFRSLLTQPELKDLWVLYLTPRAIKPKLKSLLTKISNESSISQNSPQLKEANQSASPNQIAQTLADQLSQMGTEFDYPRQLAIAEEFRESTTIGYMQVRLEEDEL